MIVTRAFAGVARLLAPGVQKKMPIPEVHALFCIVLHYICLHHFLHMFFVLQTVSGPGSLGEMGSICQERGITKVISAGCQQIQITLRLL